MVWLSGCCSCGILLAGFIQELSWPLQPATALKGFVSSMGSSSVVRNKANPDHYWRSRYALCFNIWNQAHQSEAIPHSLCQQLHWWLCSRKKRNCFSPHCSVSPPFGDSPASSFSCWRWCTHLCDLQASASLVFRFVASLFRHCNALSHILITDFLLLRSLIHSGTFSHVKLDLEPWKIS